MNNNCPNSADGRHKFYLFKTFVEYETLMKDGGTVLVNKQPVYQKVEYALSGCNCGSATKQRISDGDSL